MRKYLLLLFLFVFSFSAIHADEFSWELKDGTLTISGEEMPGYREGKSPWYGDKNIKKVIIKDGVKNIGGMLSKDALV